MQNFATFEWLLGVGKHSAQLSFTGTELYRFEVSISRNAIFFKIGVKYLK